MSGENTGNRYAFVRASGLRQEPWRVLAGVCLALALAAVTWGADQTANNLPTLTTARQIRELTAERANRGYPVRLRAVVTYDRMVNVDFFVQDATGGIFINDPNRKQDFKTGQLIEIEGVTEAPDFAPQVAKAHYTLLGEAPLPQPAKVGFDALVSTREDSQWVEIEGIVRDAVSDQGHLNLEVSTGGGRVSVFVLDQGRTAASSLVDAKVRLEGVCATIFNSNNQLIGVSLDVPSADQIQIEEAPLENPFQAPLRAIKSLQMFTAGGASEHRVHVQGTVTLVRRRGVFIQNGDQALYFPGQAPDWIARGDVVDVAGFADVGEYTPVLQHAEFRKRGTAALPAPVKVTAQQLLTGSYDTVLVTVEGTLRDQRDSEADRTLGLQDGDSLFDVRIDQKILNSGWPGTPNGSRVRVTGVCSVDVDRNRTPIGFNILLPSPASLTVLSQPSWWTPANALRSLFVLEAGLLAVLIWVAVLRRRVRTQTAMIRRRLENEAALEKRFEYVARATNDVIWDWDIATDSIWWGDGLQSVFQYSPEQVQTDAGWAFEQIHPDDRARVRGDIRAVIEGRDELWSDEYRMRRGNGDYAFVLDRAYCMRDASGHPVRLIGAKMDVTAQRLAEDQLAHERNMLRALIDHLPDYVYVKNRLGKFAICNIAQARLMGAKTWEETVGKSDFDFFPKDLAVAFGQDDKQVMESGTPLINREETTVDPEGQVHSVLTTKVPLRDRQGQVIGLAGVSRDITARKEMLEALRLSEEKFHKAFDTSPEPFTITTLDDGRYLEVNESFLRAVGRSREEVIGRTMFDIGFWRHPEKRDDLIRFLRADGKVQDFEVEFSTKDGGTRIGIISGSVIDIQGRACLLSLITDITARKQLELQLQQSQKMEAIGLLAGGMAHDFNNLLTVINGYSQSLIDQTVPYDKLPRYAEEIHQAGVRAASLTRQLLTFSRRQAVAPQILDLNNVVSAMQTMLRRLIGEDIDLMTIPGPELGRVKVDQSQIELVLVNLVVNARAAMPQGGKLTIETSNLELDETYASQHLSVTPGNYVMLAVSDSGVGMSAEVQKRAFEPFFTTKERGKGTGLGLSTVYGIVKQSGGDIWFYSEPGCGTTFKIYLPRVEETVGRAVATSAPTSSGNGNETLLLVEDERAVRMLVQETLEARGYHVLDAENGVEALRVATEHKGPLDLLITDVVMPEMGGRELAERLDSLRPGTKVLYMSGYTDDAVVRHGLVAKAVTFIQKPFNAADLAEKVRALLDSDAEPNL